MKPSYRYILGIDSSTSVLRIGLLMPDGKAIFRENEDRFRHAEFIFGLIDEVLQKGGTDKSALDAIVICTGPGSFTGLRVGMASAKGLASALNIPLVGISTYEALAPSIFGSFGSSAIVIPSGRDEFYFGLVDSEKFDINKIAVIRAGDLLSNVEGRGVFLIDSNFGKIDIPGIKKIDYSYGITDLIRIGLDRLKTKGGDLLSQLEPYYVQNFPLRKNQ